MSKFWHILNIDSLANNCGFGLEYYLFGDIEKAKPLLMEGIQFCDMIQKGYYALTQKSIDNNYSYLESWEDIQILVKSKTPEELRIIVDNTVSVKINLMEIIFNNATYSEVDVRSMQRFFNDASQPYLKKAFDIMRRIERCRRL